MRIVIRVVPAGNGMYKFVIVELRQGAPGVPPSEQPVTIDPAVEGAVGNQVISWLRSGDDGEASPQMGYSPLDITFDFQHSLSGGVRNEDCYKELKKAIRSQLQILKESTNKPQAQPGTGGGQSPPEQGQANQGTTVVAQAATATHPAPEQKKKKSWFGRG